METLTDEEVLLSLTQVLRRVTGTEHGWPGRRQGPRGLISGRAPSFESCLELSLVLWPSRDRPS